MKLIPIVYWISTALLAAQLVMAGVLYFTNPEIAAGFAHLGFPDFLRVQLGVAKLLAAVLVILPVVPYRVKEWAYAGLAITFISAFIAHTVVDDAATAIAPVISLLLLVISYLFADKRRKAVVLA